jgi:hypothetical protein
VTLFDLACDDGCGSVLYCGQGARPELDEEHPPTPRRLARMRARFFAATATTKPCCCGCGLAFSVAAGRRYHPQCPNRPGERNLAGKLHKDRHLHYDLTRRRCEMCQDLPHRRPINGFCLVCDEPYAAEVIEPVNGAPSCGLGSL